MNFWTGLLVGVVGYYVWDHYFTAPKMPAGKYAHP
jgi:hypothetical protein